MIDLKIRKRKYILAAAILAVGAVGAYSSGIFSMFYTKKNGVEVIVRDFSNGTKVNYEILADNEIVAEGQGIIKNNGALNLPLPEIAKEAKTKNLDYRLSVEMSDGTEVSAAETLELLLGLDQETGQVSVKGSGLDAFSNVIVKTGEKEDSITTDWAGLFTADALNKKYDEEGNDAYSEQVQLAFQNAGFSSDVNALGNGKVDVFIFGDSSGSNINRVQARYSWALIKMTEEFSAVIALQTQAIGMFFDTRIQLKTQMKQRELMARAHKDYHPSDQMCRIGTFVRSVGHAEMKGQVNKHALNRALMNQYLGTFPGTAAYGPQTHQYSEVEAYRQFYCDPRDFNGAAEKLCPVTGVPSPAVLDRMNKDVDFARTLGGKLTLDVDYADGAAGATPNNDLTDDEADIIALAKNLYFPNVFDLPDGYEIEQDIRPHFDSRSFVAKMGVAHNSFINIVGMKSSAPPGQPTTATAVAPPIPQQMQSPRNPVPISWAEDTGWLYMKALLVEFGITDQDGDTTLDNEINRILGERPSYYAQMEVLTKKMYQHPNFYTNLYDKPANVDRIGASLDAISLMHQRDRFESMLRREMLTSILVEQGLAKQVEDVSSTIFENMQNTPIR